MVALLPYSTRPGIPIGLIPLEDASHRSWVIAPQILSGAPPLRVVYLSRSRPKNPFPPEEFPTLATNLRRLDAFLV